MRAPTQYVEVTPETGPLVPEADTDYAVKVVGDVHGVNIEREGTYGSFSIDCAKQTGDGYHGFRMNHERLGNVRTEVGTVVVIDAQSYGVGLQRIEGRVEFDSVRVVGAGSHGKRKWPSDAVDIKVVDDQTHVVFGTLRVSHAKVGLDVRSDVVVGTFYAKACGVGVRLHKRGAGGPAGRFHCSDAFETSGVKKPVSRLGPKLERGVVRVQLPRGDW